MQFDTSKIDPTELEGLRDEYLAGNATAATQNAVQASQPPRDSTRTERPASIEPSAEEPHTADTAVNAAEADESSSDTPGAPKTATPFGSTAAEPTPSDTDEDATSTPGSNTDADDTGPGRHAADNEPGVVTPIIGDDALRTSDQAGTPPTLSEPERHPGDHGDGNDNTAPTSPPSAGPAAATADHDNTHQPPKQPDNDVQPPPAPEWHRRNSAGVGHRPSGPPSGEQPFADVPPPPPPAGGSAPHPMGPPPAGGQYGPVPGEPGHRGAVPPPPPPAGGSAPHPMGPPPAGGQYGPVPGEPGHRGAVPPPPPPVGGSAPHPMGPPPAGGQYGPVPGEPGHRGAVPPPPDLRHTPSPDSQPHYSGPQPPLNDNRPSNNARDWATGIAPPQPSATFNAENLPADVAAYIRQLEARATETAGNATAAQRPGPDIAGQRRVTDEVQFAEERASQGSVRDFTVRSGRREGPQQGWRSAVSRMGIPIGKGSAEVAYDHDIAKINKRLRHRKTVGVVAFKGGVGKTSMTMSVASTIAEHRYDGRVVAVDTVARGSMALRVKGEQPADGTVLGLANDPNLHSLGDVQSHLMTNAHRLSVLGSHRDLMGGPLTPAAYRRALEELHRHHDIVFIDTEPSVATYAYEAIVDSLDALLLIVTPTRDSAVPGRDVLPWLRSRGLTELTNRTIVLLNHTSPAKPHIDQVAITHHFHNEEKVEVLEVPYDEHLAEAGPISLDLLNKNTRRQLVRAAAMLLDKLPAN